MKHCNKPNFGPLKTSVLPMVLVLSLTGCATTSPQPIAPRLPAPPVLTQPQPPEPYSLSAQRDIQSWREKLTPTPATH